MPPDHRGSVIVVDDEPQVRRLLARMLADIGFTVTVAACGTEALSLMVDRTDLVVLDMRLPDLSGPDVARLVRRRWPDIPILFISAFPEPILKDPWSEALADGFLAKPFTREQLAGSVSRLFPV
jgi:two-component system cell cycle sensor histidine kinase/response regulator CckA